MRIFCLNFHRPLPSSLAEAFLNFSPLLQFREQQGLLFGDIQQTLWLFKSSKNLLEQALFRAEDLGFSDVSIALSDTAAGAQAFTQHFDFFISEPGHEAFSLSPLPVSSLKDLEGLNPWDALSEIEALSEFLTGLGLQSLGDLQKLPLESWNLRWGELGSRLQKKISGREKDVFTPLIPDQPLTAFHHFDFPLSDLNTLLESLRSPLQALLLRLEGREQAVDRLNLLLLCEYSEQKHRIDLSPSYKGRDADLLLKLLFERLQKVELANPIRAWELEILPQERPPQQMDFWEPQASIENENVLRLQSLLHERRVESGFLRVEPEILPEKSWSLQSEALPSQLPLSDFIFEERAHRELPVYSETLNHAPRPTQILDPPQPLSEEELGNFRFLQRYPLERLELPWQGTSRDYWMAVNANRQCAWIYRDLMSSNYFLHGYFD